MNTTSLPPEKKAIENQGAEGCRAASICSGRVVVGDIYKRGESSVVVVAVNEVAVAVVRSWSDGTHHGYAVTLDEFECLEKRTLANGAEFVPAPNIHDEATAKP